MHKIEKIIYKYFTFTLTLQQCKIIYMYIHKCRYMCVCIFSYIIYADLIKVYLRDS